jgi:hypothetical protein
MTKRLKSAQPTYEVITQEDPETGDIFLPVPQEILGILDWREGDELQFNQDDQGRWVITKAIDK